MLSSQLLIPVQTAKNLSHDATPPAFARREDKNSMDTECGLPDSRYIEILDDLRAALGRDLSGARDAATRLLNALTSASVEEQEKLARGGLAPWRMRKIDRFLREHLADPLRLEELARHVRLSVSHFCRAFKESFGDTPHNYIIRLRLEFAQNLMLTTNDPLADIALACGLADQAHLTRLFRRALNESPSAWRRRNLTEARIDKIFRRSNL